MAISKSPSPFGRYQAAPAQWVRLLCGAFEAEHCTAAVVAELDWIIQDDTVPRPDVMVRCGGMPEHHCREVPALVAGILSPSTRANDLGFKRQLDTRQGVPNTGW